MTLYVVLVCLEFNHLFSTWAGNWTYEAKPWQNFCLYTLVYFLYMNISQSSNDVNNTHRVKLYIFSNKINIRQNWIKKKQYKALTLNNNKIGYSFYVFYSCFFLLSNFMSCHCRLFIIAAEPGNERLFSNISSMAAGNQVV